jgi:hypothetical protein
MEESVKNLSVFRRRAAVAMAIPMLCAGCAPHAASPTAAVASAAGRFADADSMHSEVVADGVTHVVIHDARGPWTIHVVEIETALCEPVLQVRAPAGSLAGRATTSALATGALVTMNADFFRLPGGTPVGAQVSAGVPAIGPTDWPVFAVTAGGEWRQGRARLLGQVAARHDSVPLAQLNRAAEPFTAYPGPYDGVTLFTTLADTVPADSAAWRVLLRVLHGNERDGRAIVVAADSPAVATPVAPGSATLLARGSAAPWARRRSAGDTLTWQAQVMVPADETSLAEYVATEAVGGFPMLLHYGVDVLDQQTVRAEFGLGRHPRTALGWTDEQSRMFLVVVDGRQPPYSDGMSLPELAWLFRRLGADHALNLDGGGSTALVIGERLANRPSDAGGERSVGNALALTACRLPR